MFAMLKNNAAHIERSKNLGSEVLIQQIVSFSSGAGNIKFKLVSLSKINKESKQKHSSITERNNYLPMLQYG